MSKKDELSKTYIGQKEVYADIVNLALFEGREIIQPDMINELDPNIKMKRRDLLRKCTLPEKEEILVRIENQSVVDPSMPIRILCYDAEVYEKQLKEKKKENKGKELKEGEYLSGMRFSDRLKPVVTIVLNLSAERWEGAKDVKEMLSKEGIANGYRMRVIEPSEIEEEKLRKCKSEVWKLLQVLKYSQEGKEMIECLRRKEYEEVEEETARMIEAFTGMKKKLKVKEGKVNMCKAMEELREEWKQEGEMIGLEKGEKRGMKKANLMNARKMIESGLTEEMILKCCQITKKELKLLMLKMDSYM